MTQAVNAYRSVSASEKFRTLEKIREKTRHDEAQALYNADLQGETRGRSEERIIMAKNMISENIPLNVISKVTGLTIEEIERIGC